MQQLPFATHALVFPMTTEKTKNKKRYASKTSEQAIAHLIEECGELIAAYGKSKRWGWQSYNPELPKDKRETNQAWFLRELEDVKYAIKKFEEMQS